MSNEVNIQKLYQFIASFNKNGETWVNYADGYGGAKKDGTIIKSEFRAFVNGEFQNWNGNEGGTLTDDLISDFWKKIDTNISANKINGTKLRNLNALDKNEMASMEKTLAAYVQLDEFVSNNVKAPAVLLTTGAKWKNDVTSELSVLVEQYIKNGYQGDLNTILSEALPEIATRNTAEYCALEYQQTLKNGVLAGYPDYDISGDSTLTALLSRFLKEQVTAETTPEEIKKGVKAIIDAYLATAGLGNGSDYDLSQLGFDKDALNGAQVAVITQNIKNAVKDDAKNYEGFEEYFNEAVQKFIDSKLQSGANFATLKNCGAEFMKSKFKTDLDNLINFEKTHKDVVEKSDFHKKLVEKYGQNVADLIAKDDRYIAAYKEIVASAISQIRSGDLDLAKAEEYILTEIGNRLDEFFPNGFSDMKVEDMVKLYNTRVKAAKGVEDDDKSLEQQRKAAIDFCNAIAEKSPAHRKAVVKAFNTEDWVNKINSLTPSYIEEKMTELIEKVSTLGDFDDLTATWSAGPGGSIPTTIGLGQTKQFHMQADITREGHAVQDPDFEITYDAKVVSGGGNVKIDNAGNVTVTGSNTAGDMKIEFYVMVNGVAVGDPHTITITAKPITEADVIEKAKFNNSPTSTCDKNSIVPGDLTKYSVESLYNNDVAIRLYDANIDRDNKDYSFDNVKYTVRENLKRVLTSIVTALSNAGLNPTLLNTCKNNVLQRYVDGFTGTDVSPYDKNATQEDADKAAYNHVNANRNQVSYALVRANGCHADNHSVMVNFKDLIDDMLKEYQSLGGSF